MAAATIFKMELKLVAVLVDIDDDGIRLKIRHE